MRQKGQRHMVMPTLPSTGLVMIHPQFPFAFLNRGLHRPTQARLAHQIPPGQAPRCITQIKLDQSIISTQRSR